MELVNVNNSLVDLKKNKTFNGTLTNYEVGRTASQGSENKTGLEVKLLIISDHEGYLFFKKKLIINYNGLIDSIRGQRDGFAFRKYGQYKIKFIIYGQYVFAKWKQEKI